MEKGGVKKKLAYSLNFLGMHDICRSIHKISHIFFCVCMRGRENFGNCCQVLKSRERERETICSPCKVPEEGGGQGERAYCASAQKGYH
jgi:hypothetical protein